MWNTDIDIGIITNILLEDIRAFILKNQLANEVLCESKLFVNSITYLKKSFPNISEQDIVKIIQIACNIYNESEKQKEKVELVITAPPICKLKTRKTIAVIPEIIEEAEKSILITGYSISEYAEELLKKILYKSRQGVYVQFFINETSSKQSVISDLMPYVGKFLKIYDYQTTQQDAMQALHAKVITVDNRKALITSSNLSYHGIIKNIEMGTLVTSENVCNSIQGVFMQLIKKGMFKKLA